jgi:hypothetical protein
MLKKKVTSLLTCAALLLATAPSIAFAQIPTQLMSLDIGQNAGEAQAQPKPKLRATFAEVTTQARAGSSLDANMKRLGTEWLTPKPQAGYTKKDKILIYSIVAGLIVLAVVLGLTMKKGGHAFCDTDPSDPDCIPA